MCPECLLAARVREVRWWTETYYLGRARWFPEAAYTVTLRNDSVTYWAETSVALGFPSCQPTA